VRYGCISLGNVNCDQCGRDIPYPERYLVVEEGKNKSKHFCGDCALKRGYAKFEKGDKEINFILSEGDTKS